jgi:subtilisin-like proprotein convertase family protein
MSVFRLVMAKWVVLGMVSLAAWGANAQFIVDVQSGGAIPGQTPSDGYVEFKFNVPDLGTITDVNVRLAIAHSDVYELLTVLYSPAGTSVRLFLGYNLTTEAPNIPDIWVDDQASTSIAAASVLSYSASYRPDDIFGGLSKFNGENSVGEWKLRVYDQVDPDHAGVLYKSGDAGAPWATGATPLIGTQLEITASAVPEPQHYASAAGCLLLLYAIRRRFKHCPASV